MCWGSDKQIKRKKIVILNFNGSIKSLQLQYFLLFGIANFCAILMNLLTSFEMGKFSCYVLEELMAKNDVQLDVEIFFGSLFYWSIVIKTLGCLDVYRSGC